MLVSLRTTLALFSLFFISLMFGCGTFPDSYYPVDDDPVSKPSSQVQQDEQSQATEQEQKQEQSANMTTPVPQTDPQTGFAKHDLRNQAVIKATPVSTAPTKSAPQPPVVPKSSGTETKLAPQLPAPTKTPSTSQSAPQDFSAEIDHLIANHWQGYSNLTEIIRIFAGKSAVRDQALSTYVQYRREGSAQVEALYRLEFLIKDAKTERLLLLQKKFSRQIDQLNLRLSDVSQKLSKLQQAAKSQQKPPAPQKASPPKKRQGF